MKKTRTVEINKTSTALPRKNKELKILFLRKGRYKSEIYETQQGSLYINKTCDLQ